MSEYRKAVAYQHIAVETSLALHGGDSSQYIERKHNLAGLYTQLEEFELASDILDDLLEVVARVYGENHKYYFRLLTESTEVSVELNEIESAVKFARRAYNVASHNFPPSSPLYGTACFNLAQTQIMHYVSRDIFLSDNRDVINLLNQALSCTQQQQAAAPHQDIWAKISKIHVLMADAHSLSRTPHLEIKSIKSAIEALKNLNRPRDIITIHSLEDRLRSIKASDDSDDEGSLPSTRAFPTVPEFYNESEDTTDDSSGPIKRLGFSKHTEVSTASDTLSSYDSTEGGSGSQSGSEMSTSEKERVRPFRSADTSPTDFTPDDYSLKPIGTLNTAVKTSKIAAIKSSIKEKIAPFLKHTASPTMSKKGLQDTPSTSKQPGTAPHASTALKMPSSPTTASPLEAYADDDDDSREVGRPRENIAAAARGAGATPGNKLNTTSAISSPMINRKLPDAEPESPEPVAPQPDSEFTTNSRRRSSSGNPPPLIARTGSGHLMLSGGKSASPQPHDVPSRSNSIGNEARIPQPSRLPGTPPRPDPMAQLRAEIQMVNDKLYAARLEISHLAQDKHEVRR